MPKARDLVEVGRQGDEVVLRPRPRRGRRPARPGPTRALVIVSSGGEGLGGDDDQRLGGIEAPQVPVEVGAVDVGHEAEVEVAVDEGVEGASYGHRRAEVGAADADVDDAWIRRARWRPGRPAERTSSAKRPIRSRTSCTSGTTSSPSSSMTVPRGRRRAVCRTARSSVRLMCSPANMASRRASTPPWWARAAQELEGVPGDAVLGVVDVEVADLDDEALAPGRVVGEEVPQGAVGQLHPVRRQVPPGRALVDRQGHGRRLRRPSVPAPDVRGLDRQIRGQ